MNLIETSHNLYLASSSPRRQELLRQLGLDFAIIVADIDESVAAHELPQDYVLRMALAKAQAGLRNLEAANREHAFIIGGDTCIEWQGKIIGKPKDSKHASDMLRQLSANTHRVLSAVAVVNEIHCQVELSSTEVTFKRLSEKEIISYVESGEPMGKAGAYAIQGLAASFIENIKGSYSGVMGLPLFELTQALSKIQSKSEGMQ